jgi:hypothetical protein
VGLHLDVLQLSNYRTLVSIYSQKAVKMIDAFERKIFRQADRENKIRCEEI